MFHVSLLKPFIGPSPSSPPPLPILLHGQVCPSPAKVLKSCRAYDRLQILVQWEHAPETSASWEDLEQFKILYPSFKLEGKLFSKEGRDVMWGITYERRKKLLDITPDQS